MRKLLKLFIDLHRNKICKTNRWPGDWKISVCVILPKRGDARICEINCTIAPISHTSKILRKVIQKRLELYMERELAIIQAGFRKGRGHRDHIANIRWMMEAAYKYQQHLYMCLNDYSRELDCVDHNILWTVHREMGILEHLIILMFNLHQNQKATVTAEHDKSGWRGIRKGAKQK